MDQFHHPTFSFSAPQNAHFQAHQQQQQQPFPATPALALFPNSQQPLPFQPGHAGNEYITAPQGYQIQPQVMQQQRLPGQHHSFTSASTSTPVPVSAAALSAPPNIAPTNNAASDAVPNQNSSSYSATSQSQQTRGSNPQQSQQMATPMTSQPASQTQPALVGGPGSPLTPEQLEKEKERVTLLLEINQALLHELVNMQKQGKGGNVQQPRNANPSDENEKLAAPEYVDYMRCMQANLAYLASDADRHHKQQKMLPGPAIMRCPNPENTEIATLYKKLQEIFPNWNGAVRPAQSSLSQSQSPVATATANPNVSAHQQAGVQE